MAFASTTTRGSTRDTHGRDHLAKAIETCSAFLIFISKYSIASDDCRRELTFALTKKRPVVAVHLDDVELPSALRLQLGDRQAIIRSRFTEAEYRERLTAAMLKYQNATPALDPDASEFDGHAPIDPVKNRRRRGLLLATLLAALAITAVTLVAFKSQISEEFRAFETPVKREGIAVLPFENASGRAEDDYLSEGFSDELRDQLNRLPGLRVVARPSSIAFRDQNKPASAIAKELGVAMVVEGSLRKEGDVLHTVVRLIDATTDTQLWSESYDRNAHDTLGVQQEIAVAAAKQILPQIDPKDVPQPQWQPSVNYLMLLARNAAQNAVTAEDKDKAVSLYKQVLSVDPESAPAHARLARALFYQGQDLKNAEEHARRSVKIDPKFAEGHAVLGLILDAQFRRGAAEEFARALELNPNDADALHDYAEYLVLRNSNGTESAGELLRRAEQPRSIVTVQGWGSRDVVCAWRSGGRRRRIPPDTRGTFPDRRRPLRACADYGKSSWRTGPGNRLGYGGAAFGPQQFGRVTRHC